MRAFTRKIDHSREEAHKRMLLWVLIMVAIATFISYVVLPWMFPHSAHAQQTGPRNNKEVCQDMHKGTYIPPIGHVAESVKLCAKYGIRL